MDYIHEDDVNYHEEEEDIDIDYDIEDDEEKDEDVRSCCGRCMDCLGLSWKDFS